VKASLEDALSIVGTLTVLAVFAAAALGRALWLGSEQGEHTRFRDACQARHEKPADWVYCELLADRYIELRKERGMEK